MFDILDMGASGLTAQRIRMDTIAGNIANVNTTRDANGKPNPYRRRFVVFAPGTGDGSGTPGVHVQSVGDDPSPFIRRFEPGHPDHDKDGYVSYPNVDLSIEFVNALEASRAYEANVTIMDTTKAMFNSSLRLLAQLNSMINADFGNLGKIAGPGGAGGASSTPGSAPGGTSFSDVLKKSIGEVSRLQQDASQAVQDVATGKNDDVTGVMNAVEKSDLAFKTLLSIRAKLMDAYDEVKAISV